MNFSALFNKNMNLKGWIG